MKARSVTGRPAGKRSLRSSAVKVLYVVIFIVLIYLLGLSMVHHRFFRGGHVNPHGRLVQ